MKKEWISIKGYRFSWHFSWNLIIFFLCSSISFRFRAFSLDLLPIHFWRHTHQATYWSSLMMTLMKMIQCHFSMSLPSINTSLKSSCIWSVVTLNKKQTMKHLSISLTSSNITLSESTVTLNAQQYVDAVKAVAIALQIDLIITFSGFSSSQTWGLVTSLFTLFSSAEMTSTALCSSCSCYMCSMSTSLSQTEVVQLIYKFLDVLKSLSTKQRSFSSSAAANKVESEKASAQGSKLEFKTVNEVFVYHGIQVQS